MEIEVSGKRPRNIDWLKFIKFIENMLSVIGSNLGKLRNNGDVEYNEVILIFEVTDAFIAPTIEFK